MTSICAVAQDSKEGWLRDEFGAIVRGDVAHKNVALVFSGDEFGDGTDTVLYFLTKYNVPGSFFLSRKFYSNENHASIVDLILKKGHYVGLHPERMSQYVDVQDRSKTVIAKSDFRRDLLENYKHLARFGIKKHDVLFFMPSCACYNSTTVSWSEEMGYPVIYQTPGTLLSSDVTYPEQGEHYKTSEEIFESIISFEKAHQHQLNGFILVIHLGTDGRRTDKFYNYLGKLIEHLDRKGYNFVEINEMLE